MNHLIDKLAEAMQFAMSNRPAIGGFPFLAECLRQAGVRTNEWTLPAAQSVYIMEDGVLVQQGTPLVTGLVAVPGFDQDRLIAVLRADQAGQSTFPEFLERSWEAGVVRYVVDCDARTVTYYGAQGEAYIEAYPAVHIPELEKVILVDAINTFVIKGQGIHQEMQTLLDQYPQRKIIVTNSDDQQMVEFGLDQMPYEVFTMKHQPDKPDPLYFQTFCTHLGLRPDQLVYFEHNPDAVRSAASLGITVYLYDPAEQDLNALRSFLDSALS